jgi:hypothetical protein
MANRFQYNVTGAQRGEGPLTQKSIQPHTCVLITLAGKQRTIMLAATKPMATIATKTPAPIRSLRTPDAGHRPYSGVMDGPFRYEADCNLVATRPPAEPEPFLRKGK